MRFYRKVSYRFGCYMRSRVRAAARSWEASLANRARAPARSRVTPRLALAVWRLARSPVSAVSHMGHRTLHDPVGRTSSPPRTYRRSSRHGPTVRTNRGGPSPPTHSQSHSLTPLPSPDADQPQSRPQTARLMQCGLGRDATHACSRGGSRTRYTWSLAQFRVKSSELTPVSTQWSC